MRVFQKRAGERKNMMVGFIIWSIVAIIFGWIGIRCRKSQEAVGFFTFAKPPAVGNIEHYNRAVSVLWLIAALLFEIIGIPVLFLEQNSPLSILIIFAVVILVLGMMIAFLRIEEKYK